MITFIYEKRRPILLGLGGLLFIHIYFGMLCKSKVYMSDLYYLDFLFLAAGILIFITSYRKWKRLNDLCITGDFMEDHLELETLLGPQFYQILQREQVQSNQEKQQLQNENSDLTDYITKWAHEVKLPLASLRLMNERNPDEHLQSDMQGRLEHIQQLLNTMLMSSKLKTLENDCKYEKVILREVVQEALRNQSYFLIREQFQINIELEDAAVYTDKRWFVYILDQLIGNAIKYRRESPELTFGIRQEEKDKMLFWVEDNGIGVPKEELLFLFERGFIGSNLRGGDYRSTGMGLYFVKKITNRLQIAAEVSSEEGRYTRFTFCFQNNVSHLMI